jgi:hypothetical protein
LAQKTDKEIFLKKIIAFLVLGILELFFLLQFIDVSIAASKNIECEGEIESIFWGRGGKSYSVINLENCKTYTNTVFFTSMSKGSIVELKKGFIYYYINALIPELQILSIVLFSALPIIILLARVFSKRSRHPWLDRLLKKPGRTST